MMSEKRQKKKVIRPLAGEPVIQVARVVSILRVKNVMVQVEVDSSEEGRVTGSRKQLQDEKVHEMLSEDVEAPPPPYSPPEGKASSLSPSSLSGDNILSAPGQT